MRTHRWLLVGFTALLGIALGCQPSGTDRPHTTLGAAAGQFRAGFNADTANVRVVMLVSPTCGVCLRGAADIQKALLAKQPDPRLRAYVVWVPKLNGGEKDVPVATRLAPDERATHYWDGQGGLMRAYTQTLALPEDAWDGYLLYDPGTRWDGELPPRPPFWMHQLGSHGRPRVPGPYLDAGVFADSASQVLARRLMGLAGFPGS